MKTLLVMRHAKSSWKEPGLADHDRPLNRRGQEAAPLIGKLIKREKLIPEVILCSTAARAKQTCELLLQEWKSPPEPQYLSDLYHCPADQIAEILRHIPDSAERALLIGHNPGLEEFLQTAAGYDEKFPTAALAELAIEAASWGDVTFQTVMQVVHVWRARDLM